MNFSFNTIEITMKKKKQLDMKCECTPQELEVENEKQAILFGFLIRSHKNKTSAIICTLTKG